MIMVPNRRVRRDDSPSLFLPGDIVRHRRYGYRGVVVDCDLVCRAPDDWYRSNQTQPKREQPWYHVLVDTSAHSTYAAEENLALDPNPAPVSHPLLQHFFDDFEAGTYRRNDTPWGELG